MTTKKPSTRKSVKPADKKQPGSSRPPKASASKPRASRSLEPQALELPPLLGELDLHLFGEGRHELIYEKLGAHAITHNGVKGVSFAVWAPAAQRVNVVGNFNGWNGKQHPMRRQGDSGVWETFVPQLQSGELYKYEVKAPGRATFLKADPYAFYAEAPPATSSI